MSDQAGIFTRILPMMLLCLTGCSDVAGQLNDSLDLMHNADLFTEVVANDSPGDIVTVQDIPCEATTDVKQQESCTPLCVEYECGPDGCGGVCGVCPEGYSCKNGLCVEEPPDLCTADLIIGKEDVLKCAELGEAWYEVFAEEEEGQSLTSMIYDGNPFSGKEAIIQVGPFDTWVGFTIHSKEKLDTCLSSYTGQSCNSISHVYVSCSDIAEKLYGASNSYFYDIMGASQLFYAEYKKGSGGSISIAITSCCVASPCGDKECGDDGCGHACGVGECPEDLKCIDGKCIFFPGSD